ncbi:hypothetical protein JCM19314_2718 [Nonlabens ulvanivorans]|uniref:Uncharacterized protein n=1 Tax=Nonlabens ulvanivorans TaxID=906888 RepID=A0A090Q8Z2_NONUL|nr:DUF6427 family protein [Nonlabens ulvanivorans]GAK98687.1 hypothetical protein JCM19314_2718 [Nonlabens ulvanivorans]
MLSTFFSTSRPVHYLMVFIIVVLTVLITILWDPQRQWWELIAILILSGSLALVEFIVSKNDLTPSSSYVLWCATILSLTYLAFKVPLHIMVALFFVLLAIRRLLSLKTGHSIIKKIFDATFWIAVATVFYHWSALLYLLVFVSIFLYVRNDFRHWATPFIALGCVWVLLFTYDYVWENHVISSLWDSYKTSYLWEYTVFQSQEIILFFLIIFSVFGLFIYLTKLIDIQQSVRPRFTIMTFMGLCGIALFLIDFESFCNGGYLFLILPLSVFIARAVHAINHKIFKEILLWIPVLLLLGSFLLY